MGLDFNISIAHWSYSGFNRFRHRLADEISINLDEMEGFGGNKPWANINDPIKLFLSHSDCDGTMSVSDCKTAGKRLKQLVSSWDANDYDRQTALRLAKDMISTDKRCIFC